MAKTNKERSLPKGAGARLPAEGPHGRNYLLAVAIDDYRHCSPLNNAVLDVESFIDLMKSRYRFEDPDITFIKNEEATKKRIERAFIRLAKTIKPEDNLVVYFSGHGRYDPDLGGHWVPVEAGDDEDDWTDYLSNDLIRSYLNRIRSFHTFLIADSCFSGALFIDKSKEKFTGDRRETEPSRWGLTSGKKEIVSDGNPGEHSPFAAALLDVLRKEEKPPGVMRICDLVLEKVVANALQTPMGSPLAVRGHQGGQFVFHFRADERADWAEMEKTTEGLRRYLALYPDGLYRREAEAKLVKIAEDRAWEQAAAAGSVRALLDFEAQFPQSQRIESGELDERIAELEEEELWREAERFDTVTAYRSYIRRSHLGKYKAQALEAIDRLLKSKASFEEEPKQKKEVNKDRGKQEQRVAAEKKEEKTETEPEKKWPAPIRKLIEDMVRIEGGTFTMGSSDSDAYKDECPHPVDVSSFGIGKYPVTQAQWRAVMGNDPSYNKGCDDCPVERVSWDDTQEFLKKLNALTGRKFRLPTEAEWEFAAKGGTKSQGYKYAGSNDIDKVAWYGANAGSTQPVGQKLPNELGLYDMSGNVYEWCQDTYKPYPNCSGEASSSRVLRGGSWGSLNARYCRPSDRSRNEASNRYRNGGFRVAQD